MIKTSDVAHSAATPPLSGDLSARKSLDARLLARQKHKLAEAKTRLDAIKLDIEDLRAFDALGGADNSELREEAGAVGLRFEAYGNVETVGAMLFAGATFIGKTSDQKQALLKRGLEKGNSWRMLRERFGAALHTADPDELAKTVKEEGGLTKLTRAFLAKQPSTTNDPASQGDKQDDEGTQDDCEIRAAAKAFSDAREAIMSFPAIARVPVATLPEVLGWEDAVFLSREGGDYVLRRPFDIQVGATPLRLLTVDDLDPGLNAFCEMSLLGERLLPHLESKEVSLLAGEEAKTPGTLLAPATRILRWEGGAFVMSNARTRAGMVVIAALRPSMSLPVPPSFINARSMNAFVRDVAPLSKRGDFGFVGINPKSENKWPTVEFKSSGSGRVVGLPFPEMTSLGSSAVPFWVLDISPDYKPTAALELPWNRLKVELTGVFGEAGAKASGKVMQVEIKDTSLALALGRGLPKIIDADFEAAGAALKLDVFAQDLLSVIAAIDDLAAVREVRFRGDPSGLLELGVTSTFATYRFFIPAIRLVGKTPERSETLLRRVKRSDYTLA